MSLDKHILEIDSVELSFGDREILNSLYLKLSTGTITGLLGANGSGKSSLMKILSGELKARFKTMRLDSVWHDSFSEKELLYLPQSSYFPKDISINQAFSDFNISPLDFTDMFPEFIGSMDVNIGRLSGGERRIAEIYTTLKAKTQFVLLDEPFSQIMPLHISKIKSLICDEKSNKGILITDHLYQNIIDISDSIYIISNQTLYLTDSVSDLVKHGYISASNHLTTPLK